jgi:AcrR family transcriptional regulator
MYRQVCIVKRMAMKMQQPSVRERLLAAANELFYEEGVHSVGIDRVIERAGVAKASLYSTFGSKEELVRAYLEGRHEKRRQRIARAVASHETPRARLLAVFDSLEDLFREPGFRGCPFVNASAESNGDAVKSACGGSRAWVHSVFADLGREAGVQDPEGLARDLVLLYDGAITSAHMDRNPESAATARRIAAVLIDAAVSQAAVSQAAVSQAAVSQAAVSQAAVSETTGG